MVHSHGGTDVLIPLKVVVEPELPKSTNGTALALETRPVLTPQLHQ